MSENIQYVKIMGSEQQAWAQKMRANINSILADLRLGDYGEARKDLIRLRTSVTRFESAVTLAAAANDEISEA